MRCRDIILLTEDAVGSRPCAAAKAVATCLLDLRCAHGPDGHTPLAWEVVADHLHAGLAG